MRMKASSLFLMAILGVTAVLFALSLAIPDFDTKAFPTLVAGVILILGAIELRGELAARKDGEGRGSVLIKGDWHISKIVSTASWILGLPLAVWLLGFRVAIPLFVLSYLRFHGRGWLISIILTVLTTIFLIGIFEFALGVELYKGLVFLLLERGW